MSGAPGAHTDHALHNPIEAEEDTPDSSDVSDIDSVYSSEAGSITDSLTTYVTRYKYLHGRRYDSKHAYVVSNDEAQQDQMDIFHEIYFRACGNRRFVAPIPEKPQRILDLGTGTGIWAVDVADAYPSATVVGTDLSPIQPSWVPPNCEFQIDDFNNEAWTFTKDSCDFVHARSVHGAVKDWGEFLKKIFSILKPGGWVEIVGEDLVSYCDDGTTPSNAPFAQYLAGCIEGMKKLEIVLDPYHDLQDPFREAGFDMSSFKHEIFPAPIGTWPKKREHKESGAMMLVNLLQGIEGWSLFIWTQVLGKSLEEYQALLASWKEDLRVKKQHKYLKINVIYAQKPL